MGTSRARWGAVATFVWMTSLGGGSAWAGEPVAGIDVGAAIPIGDFKRLAEPGAAIAPFAGYRWGDTLGIALLAQPQYTLLSSDEDVRKRDDDLTTIFSLTAGPRLSLASENAEAWLSAQGGFYTPTSGPFSKSAQGFNLAAGFSFVLSDSTNFGVYIRRDEASIKADEAALGIQDRGNIQFLVAGLDLQHRFLPAAEAPAPVVPVPTPVAEAPVLKQKIVLRGVNFDTNKASIRDDARPLLDEAARVLAQNPAVKVSVEGHTDSRNTDAYNQKLSERRAASVHDYLVEKGIEKARLTAVGFGESRPVASNDTVDGMAQNRRVELKITAGE